MERIFCTIHKANIIIYDGEEKNSFIDDNKAETIIFIDERGNKELKRYVIGKCDEHCGKMKELLNKTIYRVSKNNIKIPRIFN